MNRKKISVMILAFIIGSTLFMPKSYLPIASNRVYAATINENLPVMSNMQSKSIDPVIQYLTIKAIGTDHISNSNTTNMNRLLPLICIDSPISKTYITNKIIISGWSLNSSRVSSVDILIDGNKVGNAILGIARPDVKKTFPIYNDITSGFIYTLDTSKLSPTSHKITIVSNGNDGSYADQSITLNKSESSPSTTASENKQSIGKTDITLADWALNPSRVNHIKILVDNPKVNAAPSGNLTADANRTYSDHSKDTAALAIAGTENNKDTIPGDKKQKPQGKAPEDNTQKANTPAVNNKSLVSITSLILNENTYNLTVGDTNTLTANIAPINASNKALSWTSSDNAVAEVTDTGKVTAVGAGTAKITATTKDGSKTSSCAVTVNTKKGYVYNPELEIDLNVRSAPNLDSKALGFMYNYERFDILGSTVDGDGNVWDKIIYNGNTGYISDAYVQKYTSPPDNVVKIASNITKTFSEITGNTDDTSLSPGYIKQSLSQGTLQPLLNRMDRQYNDELKSIFGTNYDALHNMILDTPKNQSEWADSISDSSNKIIEPWYSQLSDLFGNKDFINIKSDAQVYTVKQAMIICDKYNLKTSRGFTLAFDISMQNGGITSDAEKIIDGAIHHNPDIPEKELLQVIANATANTAVSDPDYIRERETAIINGQGNVHGNMLYLDSDYGLSDKLWR
ncbi:Ig-like domain-containing protein [Clostridium arbusti]|uniref:Ig-like domain-containing protein n=1 Tax=Clostridium arbusti TaxID=1137848 RepID=UPI00028926CA|nr:Ig-like domain-containing protein [Clostridium arbusti]